MLALLLLASAAAGVFVAAAGSTDRPRLETVHDGLSWSCTGFPDAAMLWSVTFVDSQRGWMTKVANDSSNHVLYTTNAGDTWSDAKLDSPMDAPGIPFVHALSDELICAAAETASPVPQGAVKCSHDGERFFDSKLEHGAPGIHRFVFSAGSHGDSVALTSPRVGVHMSDDGGRSFQFYPTVFANNVPTFANDDVWYFNAGSAIFKSADRARSTPHRVKPASFPPRGAQGWLTNEAMVCWGNAECAGVFGSVSAAAAGFEHVLGSKLWVTRDGGQTWANSTLLGPTFRGASLHMATHGAAESAWPFWLSSYEDGGRGSIVRPVDPRAEVPRWSFHEMPRSMPRYVHRNGGIHVFDNSRAYMVTDRTVFREGGFPAFCRVSAVA